MRPCRVSDGEATCLDLRHTPQCRSGQPIHKRALNKGEADVGTGAWGAEARRLGAGSKWGQQTGDPSVHSSDLGQWRGRAKRGGQPARLLKGKRKTSQASARGRDRSWGTERQGSGEAGHHTQVDLGLSWCRPWQMLMYLWLFVSMA